MHRQNFTLKITGITVLLFTCWSINGLRAQESETPIPFSITNFLLEDNSLEYSDLALLSASIFERNGTCIPMTVVGSESSTLENGRITDYVNQSYRNLFLRIEGLEGINISAVAEISPRPINFTERFEFPHQHFREQTYKSWISENEVEEFSIIFYLVGDELANTTGVYVDENKPTNLNFIIGENFVLDNDFTALERLLANSFGLPPIWGDGRTCESDDGISDTPNHNAPNYDCVDNHYNGCFGNKESMYNLMDARICEFDKILTPLQKVFLSDALLKIDFTECQLGRESVNNSELCESLFNLTGFVSASNDVEIRVQSDGNTDYLSLGQINYQVSTVSREISNGIFDPNGESQINLNTMNSLPPGIYTITLKGDFGMCTTKTVKL
jgi:hypothetical protein